MSDENQDVHTDYEAPADVQEITIPAEMPFVPPTQATPQVVHQQAAPVVGDEPVNFPMALEEFELFSKASRVFIAGFRASLQDAESPRMLPEWEAAYKAYQNKPVEG